MRHCILTSHLWRWCRATHGLPLSRPQFTVGVLAGTHLGATDAQAGWPREQSANPCRCFVQVVDMSRARCSYTRSTSTFRLLTRFVVPGVARRLEKSRFVFPRSVGSWVSGLCVFRSLFRVVWKNFSPQIFVNYLSHGYQVTVAFGDSVGDSVLRTSARFTSRVLSDVCSSCLSHCLSLASTSCPSSA